VIRVAPRCNGSPAKAKSTVSMPGPLARAPGRGKTPAGKRFRRSPTGCAALCHRKSRAHFPESRPSPAAPVIPKNPPGDGVQRPPPRLMSNVSTKLSFGEKLGYSLGDAAANFVFMTMILFQSNFYTDVF